MSNVIENENNLFHQLSFNTSSSNTLSIHEWSNHLSTNFHPVHIPIVALCPFTYSHTVSVYNYSLFVYSQIITIYTPEVTGSYINSHNVYPAIDNSVHAPIVTHCLFTIVTHYLFTNSHTAQWDLQLDILLIKQYAHFVQTQMVTFLFTNLITLRQSIK